MGRWSPHLGEDQRDAIARAMLARKTAAEVASAVAAGELDQLPPFDVSETTCRDIRAEQERRQDRAEGNGHAAAEESEAVRIAKETVRRVAAMSEPKAKDLSALEQAQRIIDKAAKQTAKTRPRKPAKQKRSELAKRLLAEKQAHDKGACLPHCTWHHGN
jgi:hypothetical protein